MSSPKSLRVNFEVPCEDCLSTCSTTDDTEPYNDEDVRQIEELTSLIPENTSGMSVVGRIRAQWIRSNPKWDIQSCESKAGCVVMLLPGQGLEGLPFIAARVVMLDRRDISILRKLSQFCSDAFYGQFITDNPEFWYGGDYLCLRASDFFIVGGMGQNPLSKKMRWYGLVAALPGLALLTLFYGGLHLTFWNNHFPSFIEQYYLWRTAACIIASGGAVLWLMTVIGIVTQIAPGGLYEIWNFKTRNLAPFSLFLYVWIFVYAVSRLYLITESFISLRSLPIGAYKTVTWINLLPKLN